MNPTGSPSEKRTFSSNMEREDYISSVVAGTLSTLAIAPIMCVSDLAILRSQAQEITLAKAVRLTSTDLLTNKAKWNPALTIVWGAYAATYVSANTTRQVCRDIGINPLWPTALVPAAVNAVAVALKDMAYSKMIASVAASQQKVSLTTLALFGCRDSITMAATFVMRDDVRDWLVEEGHTSPHMADFVSSFGVPTLSQVFSAPFHILAFDRIQRPTATLSSRWSRIASSWASVTVGRMVRIVPAFGIGGYLNDKIRVAVDHFQGMVELPDEVEESGPIHLRSVHRRDTIWGRTK